MSLEGKTPEEISALAALADDVLGNPKTAGYFQRLVKQNNPGVSMPLIELEDKAAAAFKTQAERIAALEGQLAQRGGDDATNSLYESVKDAGHVRTKAEFAELCKYANDHGMMCTEMGLRNASMLKQQEEESAVPTPQTINHGNFAVSDSADLSKAFFRDPKGTAATQAAQAMIDLGKMRAQQKGVRTH